MKHTKWEVTLTPSGKPKVVDDKGFSICNMGGGSYKDQMVNAQAIAQVPMLIKALEDLMNACAHDTYAQDELDRAAEVLSLVEEKIK